MIREDNIVYQFTNRGRLARFMLLLASNPNRMHILQVVMWLFVVSVFHSAVNLVLYLNMIPKMIASRTSSRKVLLNRSMYMFCIGLPF